jgi:hypothetical protein
VQLLTSLCHAIDCGLFPQAFARPGFHDLEQGSGAAVLSQPLRKVVGDAHLEAARIVIRFKQQNVKYALTPFILDIIVGKLVSTCFDSEIFEYTSAIFCRDVRNRLAPIVGAPAFLGLNAESLRYFKNCLFKRAMFSREI